MSFGGSVSAMMTSLKNNKRTRPSAFKKLKNVENGAYKKGSIDKKASPKLLKELREKTIRENKERLLKNVLILSTIALILFLVVWLS
mgnify:CR=1 FL=1|jgi:hypothetical protein